MSEYVIKTLVNSTAHSLLGIAGGAAVDAFFHHTSTEDGLSQVSLFSIQTIVNGLLISNLIGANVSDTGEYSDPTGGAFLIFSTLYAQRNYRLRLEELAGMITTRLTSLLPSTAMPIMAVSTENLVKGTN
jgi:hypothetical protein